MTLDFYEKQAVHTKLYPEEKKIEYCALGLTGEAGEVAEKVKKWLRGDKELDYEELKKELGDVLWYVTAMATDIGSSLEEVAQMNIDKLSKRKDEGKIRGDGDNR